MQTWLAKLNQFFHHQKLNTKLLMMMFLLLLLSLTSSFLMYSFFEKAMVKEVEDNTTDLSKAIQVSVEELTSTGETNEARLGEYVKSLSKKGVKEISILSNENEVIASSNPKHKGAHLDPKHKDLIITEKLGADLGPTAGQKPYNIIVPIIVGDEQLGYVHINMLLDDFSTLIKSNLYKRLFVTLVIFTLGIMASLWLSRKYTHPIKKVVEAAKKVAAGDLSKTLQIEGGDEIGELTHSFNEMVERLRQQRELEERLRTAERFSTIGQLASGIAHEFRNPLNFISLSIDHLKSQMEADVPSAAGLAADLNARLPGLPQQKPGGQGQIGLSLREEALEVMINIKREIHRLNQMVENFLRYGKPQKLHLQEVEIGPLLSEVMDVARHKALEQGVAIRIEHSNGLSRITADREQLKTCFMNIAANAIQAMPQGGELKIETETDQRRNEIRILFSDTGHGISEEALQRIFQPYFTTKRLGIGLGLALTQRIVHEHGGKIIVLSQLNHGTRVVVTLPVDRQLELKARQGDSSRSRGDADPVIDPVTEVKK
jgi:signal transduction histidine kinase